MADIQLSSQAYCKLMLHALKYPHASVIGVLIGEKKKGHNSYRIIDSVPVAHQSTRLVPTIEAALCQIDAFCQQQSRPLHVIGIYHAAENLFDSGRDPYICRIADKLYANNSDSIILTIENQLLSVDASEPCYTVYSFSAESKSWREKAREKFVLEDEERSLAAASVSIQTKLYRELIDFDNHLDNPSLDFFNHQLNAKIEKAP